jgi:hypothetical protein
LITSITCRYKLKANFPKVDTHHLPGKGLTLSLSELSCIA